MCWIRQRISVIYMASMVLVIEASDWQELFSESRSPSQKDIVMAPF